MGIRGLEACRLAFDAAMSDAETEAAEIQAGPHSLVRCGYLMQETGQECIRSTTSSSTNGSI